MPRDLLTAPGKIVALQGKAVARSPNGELRLLAVGDLVGAGDMIISEPNGFVQLAYLDAPPVIEQVSVRLAEAPVVAASESVIQRPAAAEALPQPLEATSSMLPGLRVASSGGEAIAAASRIDAAGPQAPTLRTGGRTEGSRFAPEAESQRLATLEDTALPIRLGGGDADGSVARFVVDRVPTGGVMSKPGGQPFTDGADLTPAEAGGLLFTPAPDFNGNPGSLLFRVIDNQGQFSAVAKVEISVTAVNDAPRPGTVPLGPDDVAIADPSPNLIPGSGDYRYTTAPDTPLSGRVNATDVDLDPMRFSAASEPQNGRVVVDPDGRFDYIPNADFRGIDQFVVLVDDGRGGQARSTVFVEVATTDSGRTALPGGEAEALMLVQPGQEVFAWHLSEPARLDSSGAPSGPAASPGLPAAPSLGVRDLLTEPSDAVRPAQAGPGTDASSAPPAELAVEWMLRQHTFEKPHETGLPLPA